MTVLVSAGVGVVASVLTAYVTAHLAARQEMQRWRKDLAEKYAALAADRQAVLMITKWFYLIHQCRVAISQYPPMTNVFTSRISVPRTGSVSMIAGSTVAPP